MPSTVDVALQKLEMTIYRVKPQLVDAIGKEAILFVDKNFELQGFQGTTFEPWDKLQHPPKRSRKILQDKLHMRHSFSQHNHSDHSSITSDDIKARTHNEGLTIRHPSRDVILSFRYAKGGRSRFAKVSKATHQQKVTIKDYTIKMPKRQFVGESPVLSRACEKTVLKILIPALNS